MDSPTLLSTEQQQQQPQRKSTSKLTLPSVRQLTDQVPQVPSLTRAVDSALVLPEPKAEVSSPQLPLRQQAPPKS